MNYIVVQMYGLFQNGTMRCAFKTKELAIGYRDMLVNLGEDTSNIQILRVEIRYEV